MQELLPAAPENNDEGDDGHDGQSHYGGVEPLEGFKHSNCIANPHGV